MNEVNTKATLTIDGQVVEIGNETNLLQLARNAGIEIPTFCYHEGLSSVGACRLCLVEIEGRGIVTSCTTKPEANIVVHTRTEQIRQMRKVAVELYLANHEQDCPTCARSANCKLQTLARDLGVNKVRFHNVHKHLPLDCSSASLIRDPNKCVQCGNCVRTCKEIQGVGAIDFAWRGHDVVVTPAFKMGLGEVDCVNCGQCAAACPVGAITPRSEVEGVWSAISNKKKTVVACIAPAVRVAIGEMFGLPAGESELGRIATALRLMGFDKVYDTSFSADLTVFEEASEFLTRFTKGEKLPQFTSCCPAWVKYAEHNLPELLPNLSSCKSPQQMFGSVIREYQPAELGCAREDLVIVSIMPCTAKKYEAQRPEFSKDGLRDVDYVITTQELGRMINEAGLNLKNLKASELDLPLGMKSGAGVLFGVSGGVTEAALRFAAEKLTGKALEKVDFEAVRGFAGLRSATVEIGSVTLRLAQVSGLKNARTLIDMMAKGEAKYDLVEVMACPNGCINGAGQPINECPGTKEARTNGIYAADAKDTLRTSQANTEVQALYTKYLGEIGGHTAHELLHTTYTNRAKA